MAQIKTKAWNYFIVKVISLLVKSETLVILLQETHFNDAEKLVLPNYQLAGSSLSRKHGLATFVHERLRYTLLDQSPPTSEIEWLCVDVDGYKIVNVYKPPPTRLRSLDVPVSPHPCLYAGDFNSRHADWGYDDNSPYSGCLAGWASINYLALLYNAKPAASFYSGRWNPGTNPDLGFASVGPNSCLPNRRVLDKFSRSQHRPSLITPPRFAMTLSLAYRGSLDPDHILHGLLSGSSDTRQVRLRSRRLFVPVARNLLDNLARLGIRASEWTNHKWNAEYCENASRLRVFVPETGAMPVGMGLPRAAWVKLNHLRTGVGRFHSSMHKWGLVPSPNCECVPFPPLRSLTKLRVSSPRIPNCHTNSMPYISGTIWSTRSDGFG